MMSIIYTVQAAFYVCLPFSALKPLEPSAVIVLRKPDSLRTYSPFFCASDIVTTWKNGLHL